MRPRDTLRTYSIHQPRSRALNVVMFDHRHADTLAKRWGAAVSVGDEALFGRPPVSRVIRYDAQYYLSPGEETASVACAAMLRSLPKGKPVHEIEGEQGVAVSLLKTAPDAAGPPVTAVLWDVDGTLLSSGGVVVRAFLDSVEDVVGRRPEGRGLDLGGRIDPEIAAMLLQSVDADEALIPEVLDRHRLTVAARSDELRANVTVLPGVLETLQALAGAGVRQTVVTGNVEAVGLLKLHAAELIPPIDPGVGGFGDHGQDRAEVATSALDRLVAAGWVHAPDQCWIVGDTPRDLSCARATGVRCALVATGRHSAESLAALGADVVINGFTDAKELLTLWNLPD